MNKSLKQNNFHLRDSINYQKIFQIKNKDLRFYKGFLSNFQRIVNPNTN